MLPVLSADKIRNWDSFTIENEPISSIDLMERASNVFCKWFLENKASGLDKILLIASKGNNGGDGLAVARLLIDRALDVDIFVADIQMNSTSDFEINLQKLLEKRIDVKYIQKGNAFPEFGSFDIIIDAIFGSGLERPITGYWATFVNAVNNSGKIIYSIDIPSGIYSDKAVDGAAVKCDHCLSFESPKLGMLLPDNSEYIKNWNYKTIGLKKEYLDTIHKDTFYIEKQDVKALIKPRNRFGHKGNFGHGLLIGGSKGMIGAVVLSSKACLRTGAGLVTALLPDIGYPIIQSAVPEAIAIIGYGEEFLSESPDISRFSAVGIGTGISNNKITARFLKEIIPKLKVPVVFDADALNILSENKDILDSIPKQSILTPHLGEFSRLFGNALNGFERIKLLRQKAIEYQFYIILKGRYTAIATPEGNVYFNSSGNVGMATAGSGDVLTGIITSLLAQGYFQFEACIAGVYIHGLAGEIASGIQGLNSLIASDIIENIGSAYEHLVGVG
jgi:NAD(P)H-hydrate epimerase